MKPFQITPPIIETGRPPSLGREKPGSRMYVLREAIRSMSPEQTFDWPENDFPYRAAKKLGLKIKTEKLDGSGYRVRVVGPREDELPPVWQPRCANEPRWPM